MGHSCSGNLISCPVHTATVLILSLRDVGATPDTPLSITPHGSKLWWIWSAEITATLYLAAHSVSLKLVLRPNNISTRAMRTNGAMALILGVIYYEKIKLLGWCCSYQMMMYLHMSNHLLLHKCASVMVNHGN